MAEADDQSYRPADPLRVDRCPDCGYLLFGLPERGVCPECGCGYDPAMIVLYGWEKGKAPSRRRRLRHWAIGLALGAGALLLGWWAWRQPAGAAAWLSSPWGATFMLGAGAGAAVVLRSIVRKAIAPAVPPAPMQLRMTPAGFALREGFGPADLRPWNASMGVGLERLSPRRHVLFSEYNGRRVAWWEGLEVCCDESTALRIRQRVARWCREAAGDENVTT